ncbi:MAG TPA: LysR family transcriptional regulator [Terriglobales bacterium]|nr:LysR family transcriptional regulator [Terriglobales bacterium]
MTDRFFALRLFLRVARTRSFSKAGREFGLSQPSVSRILAELEREVGASLVARTTRAVTLTEAGADYLARVEPILVALEEADDAVRCTGTLRGSLRVGVSSGFGVREVIPRLPGFVAGHPALAIDLVMNDQRQDLIGDGVDVVFRFGALADSSAKMLHIARTPRLLVASPRYITLHGMPKTPADLAEHVIIAGPAGIPTEGWSFEKKGRKTTVRLESRLNIGQHEGAIAAAVAGLGIVSTTYWGCRDEIEDGRLVRLLGDWDMGLLAVNAIFTAGRTTKPAARALAEYIAGELKPLGS